LWRLDEQRFRLSAADPSLRWFEDCAVGLDVEVRDVSRRLASLAIQGPESRHVLEETFGVSLAALRFFRGTEISWKGVQVGVTRTGFTGDLGYELWVGAEDAAPLWDALLAQGAGYGLLPAGLQALDAARIEAGLILIEVDFFSAAHALLDSRKSTPFDLGLGWTVQLTDGNDFVGRAALERRPREWTVCGVAIDWAELERLHRPRGLRPLSVGLAPDRRPSPLRRGGRQVGQITSRVFSPLLKRQIGIASVHLEALGIETATGAAPDLSHLLGITVEVRLDIDRERVPAAARICSLPHYDPPQKRSRFEGRAK
jgi:aminomethyltransferase